MTDIYPQGFKLSLHSLDVHEEMQADLYMKC
jgi:hypothetical protein